MKVHRIVLDGEKLEASTLWNFAKEAMNPKAQLKIELSPKAEAQVQKAADFVSAIVKGSAAVYGINTGFGKFAEVRIGDSDLASLQTNLILSHCCGVGRELERDIVMAMWVLRLNTMCRGNSGVRMSTIRQIIRSLELGFLSVVPSRGSVGASGDLAPSAHATLGLLGEGFCTLPSGSGFERIAAKEGLKKLGLEALSLGPKEGLSLINGTQTTTALALKASQEGKLLLKTANFTAAMMIEGLRGSHAIVHDGILTARNQPGAVVCGNEMRAWLDESSEISLSHENCGKVQDAYSLRCAPQVHGSVHDELRRADEVLNYELNASTDNPLIFPESQESLSGGNFHAIYTARVSDSLATAFTLLASISERRIAQAMSKESSGLPTFLIQEGGLHSGFMMAQVTAAALVSEAKTQCFPASVDSIPTNDDREDHVSMGPTAGYKALRTLAYARQVLAIELLVAAQALDFLKPLRPSKRLEQAHSRVRSQIPHLSKDRILGYDIETATELVRSGSLFSS